MAGYLWQLGLEEFGMITDNTVHHTLIVDDERDICFLLKVILGRRNTSVSCANSIAEAKTELARQVPDVLFLDNCLPDGLGIEFIHFVKEKCPDADIVVISAHDNIGNQLKAITLGAKKFLPKPLNVDDLDHTIQQLYGVLGA